MNSSIIESSGHGKCNRVHANRVFAKQETLFASMESVDPAGPRHKRPDNHHSHHTFTGVLMSIAKLVKVCQINTTLIKFVTVCNTWGEHLTWYNNAS